MNRWLSVVLVVVAIPISGAMCGDRPLPRSLEGIPSCPLVLGPEDVVTIRVFGEEALSGDYQADTEGNLDFPFVGRINLAGKTNTSLSDFIKGSLVEGEYLVSPQVSVLIKEHKSARVSVDGRVSKSSTLPFKTGMTLREAISQAGGMTPIADRNNVRLTRMTPDGPVTEVVSVRAIYDGRVDDVRLCPSDSVYVPESRL